MSQFLCLSRDVKEGCYTVVTTEYGDEYVVWRKSGVARASRNACPHRGFPVAEGSGALPIVCRYHGLPFSCPGVPVTETTGGFLFLTNDLPPDAEAALLHYGGIDDGFEFGQSPAVKVRAPAHLWLQNTADPNHLLTVHPNFAKQFTMPPVPKDMLITASQSSYRLAVRPEVVEQYEKLVSVDLPPYFRHTIILPWLSLTSFLDVFFSAETAIPLKGGDSCLVTTRFFTPYDLLPKKLLDAAATTNWAILREDREIVERWALGRPWQEPKRWLPGEERIRDFFWRQREHKEIMPQ